MRTKVIDDVVKLGRMATLLALVCITALAFLPNDVQVMR